MIGWWFDRTEKNVKVKEEAEIIATVSVNVNVNVNNNKSHDFGEAANRIEPNQAKKNEYITKPIQIYKTQIQTHEIHLFNNENECQHTR